MKEEYYFGDEELMNRDDCIQVTNWCDGSEFPKTHCQGLRKQSIRAVVKKKKRDWKSGPNGWVYALFREP